MREGSDSESGNLAVTKPVVKGVLLLYVLIGLNTQLTASFHRTHCPCVFDSESLAAEAGGELLKQYESIMMQRCNGFIPHKRSDAKQKQNEGWDEKLNKTERPDGNTMYGSRRRHHDKGTTRRRMQTNGFAG